MANGNQSNQDRLNGVNTVDQPRRKRITIALAILVAILAALLIFVQVRALSELRLELEAEERLLYDSQRELVTLRDHQARADEYRDRLAYVERKMPPRLNEEEVMLQLYRLASDSEMEVSDLRIGTRGGGDQYSAIPVTMTLSGSYMAMRKLVSRISSADPAYAIDTITVNRSAARGSSVSVNLSLRAIYE